MIKVLYFIARFGWIFLRMIATFSTSSHGRLPLWLQTKILKNTALYYHRQQIAEQLTN
jgi:hypothetical protein